MKLRIIAIWFIAAFFAVLSGRSQNKPDNACYITNNRIYFKLNKLWSEKEKKEMSGLYNIDSILLIKAFQGNNNFIYDSIPWEVTSIDENNVELSKPVDNPDTSYNPNDVFLLDDKILLKPSILKPIFSAPKPFGVNKFEKEPVITINEGIARFVLQGFPNAGQVYLAGTFNNWSTMQNPMKKSADGWEIHIKLVPGQYLYKYIVDGRWIHDPGNKLKENDWQGGFNSIFYCYNHVFRLKGYGEAKKVFLTGSFNNWNKKELRMIPSPSGWYLPIYLEEGTHAYKFIVDGNWINDPENKIVHADAWGNMNSFMGIGDTLMFRLKGYTTANTVILSGSFNGWSTSELVMNKTDFGWEIPYVLGAGNYEYKFIVDGKWITDPDNPLTSGSGDFVNSCITFKPNYTFKLDKFTEAKSVLVTGSFNGWREDGYPMIKQNDIWILPVSLKPGKYTYKFIVDGQWTIDPTNEYWEENEYGTGNSVLWIEP